MQREDETPLHLNVIKHTFFWWFKRIAMNFTHWVFALVFILLLNRTKTHFYFNNLSFTCCQSNVYSSHKLYELFKISQPQQQQRENRASDMYIELNVILKKAQITQRISHCICLSKVVNRQRAQKLQTNRYNDIWKEQKRIACVHVYACLCVTWIWHEICFSGLR